MGFRVADPAALDRCRSGDRIRFPIEKRGGDQVVTGIGPAK
jgi:Cu/Ag efflux protein CusF